MKTVIRALQNPDPTVTIRPVRMDDVDALNRACWPQRPRMMVQQLVARAQRIARQERGLGVVIVGDTPKELRGFGQLTLWSKVGEISDLMVAEPYRGHGYGTAMIQYLMRTAREMHIPAVEIGAAFSNPGALSLYRRLGFEDDHKVMIDLGQGKEPVMYLRVNLTEYGGYNGGRLD